MSDLFIALGEYVIVQDGVLDQPKIVVWDEPTLSEDSTLLITSLRPTVYDEVTLAEDLTLESHQILPTVFDNVTLVEAFTVQLNPIFLDVSETVTLAESTSLGFVPNFPVVIAVFDVALAEDPTLPQLLFNFPIAVFDIVIVSEGQSDFAGVAIELFDAVTVTEQVSMAMTLLRVNIFDNVTVIDAPGVFAEGAVGILANETVTVQEVIGRYLSLYINAFDVVIVTDGAVAPDIFDAVTITEDVTLKLARLLIAVNETVTIVDSIVVFGISHNVIEIIDELVVDDAVEVLLTSLMPEAFDTVTVTESVTVAPSSIAVLMDLADSVTLEEALTVQTNPLQIDEFTQVVLTESIITTATILNIAISEDVTVAESVDVRLLPILLEVFDDVTLAERIALRVSKAGRKRHDLTVVGAGE